MCKSAFQVGSTSNNTPPLIDISQVILTIFQRIHSAVTLSQTHFGRLKYLPNCIKWAVNPGRDFIRLDVENSGYLMSTPMTWCPIFFQSIDQMISDKAGSKYKNAFHLVGFSGVGTRL